MILSQSNEGDVRVLHFDRLVNHILIYLIVD